MSWFPASSPSQRWAYALTAIVTATAVPAHAQAPLKKNERVDESHLPVTVRAEEASGRPDREFNLERDVEIIRGQTRITSDSACFKYIEDEVTARS